MEPACIRQTDLPGTSRLFSDFSYHFDCVAQFYGHDPHDPASFATAARQIDYPDARRAAMVKALARQNGESESLRRFAQPGTVAVVTGQQVGLFSGPAYTIYKALTAARTARDLTERGIPAVPVFWLATEDHDFEEVNHLWSFNSQQQPVRLGIQAVSGKGRPVGGITIDQPPVDELRRCLAGLPHANEVVDAVAASYRPGGTMAEGFQALLQKILGSMGLIFVDPLDPELRQIAAPLLANALSAAPELKAGLLERNRELAASGYHAQVLVEADTSLFFLLERGERVTLKRKDAEFAELRDRATEISPNALLRPVMQDYMLPTVAYVGGPAELAYLAQSKTIYDRLLGRMPVVLSRSSFTLLDLRAQKLLARFQLSVPETLIQEELLKERMARALVPDTISRAIESTRTEVESRLVGLCDELERFDPTLAASLGKSRSKMMYQLGKVGRKTAREILRRDTRASADAQYLHGLLFPHGHMQERFYSILPFLAKHGMDMVDRVYDAVRLDCPDHGVLTL